MICYKIHLAIWNFKVAHHCGLLGKNFFIKRSPLPIGWTLSLPFSEIRVRFWDRQGPREDLTSSTHCIFFNNRCKSTQKIISKWSQKQWSWFFETLLNVIGRGAMYWIGVLSSQSDDWFCFSLSDKKRIPKLFSKLLNPV